MAYILGLVRNFSPVQIFSRASSGSGASFSVPPQAENMVLEAVGVGGSATALTVDLEVSHDGGTTWQKLTTGLALIAASVGTASRVAVTGLAGALCRLTSTTFTLGAATTISVTATVT